MGLALDQVGNLIKSTTRSSIESDGNDDIQTEAHGAFEIVRLAILNNISDDKNGDCESNGFN